jgi:hypothetical protein
MSPHRRRCLTKAILEIKGTLSGVTAEVLLKMTNAELLALFVDLEKVFAEGATITEPAPDIQDMETIVMEAVQEKKKD